MVMVFLLSISLYFVFKGGQIAVIVADFFQGIFVTAIFIAILAFFFFTLSWEQISDSLRDTPIVLAEKEMEELKTDKFFQELNSLEQDLELKKIEEKFENSSGINPFKTGHVEDFNFGIT